MISAVIEYGTKHQSETYPVLIDKSHVRWDGLYIVCLCFHLSDLIQVQLRKLELLLTLGDLGVKVDQALGSLSIRREDGVKQTTGRTRTRMWTLIVDVRTVDPQPGGISLASRTTSTDLQPLVSVVITPF